MTNTPPLFAGLKVIDCATFIAAPTAATVLADYGADVIKVEPPGEGDPWRNVYTRPEVPQSPHNYPYLANNRNKRGIAIDLKTPSGQAAMARLVGQADVFITNLPLPVRARLGLRYEDFATRFPRLIYGSFTAYGETGDEAAKTGFDLTAYWARSGLMDQVRPDHTQPPAQSVAGLGDHPSGMALYGGIATALYRRERTGLGGEVRTSLLGSGMWANAVFIQASLCGATIPPRPPREEARRAAGNAYRTGDDRWFILALSNEARQWPALAAAIGRPELVSDPRFIDSDDRMANARALIEILDDAFARRTLAEWRRRLDNAGLTFGIVATTEETARDHQATETGILRPIEGTDLMTVDSPFTLTGSDKAPITAAPGLGAHSGAILRDFGFSEAEIVALRADGVVTGG